MKQEDRYAVEADVTYHEGPLAGLTIAGGWRALYSTLNGALCGKTRLDVQERNKVEIKAVITCHRYTVANARLVVL